MGTSGGQSVVIGGTNFGPVGGVAGYASPNASYGVSGTTYSIASCVVTTAHVELRCDSVAGVGSGLRWVVSVGGQSSALSSASVTTSYAAPVIGSLIAVAGSDSLSGMPTSGGTRVQLSGTNFGPATGNPVTARSIGSGLSWSAAGCVIVTPHTLVECTTSEGFGSGLLWRVSVGGQESIASVDSTSYLAPSISSLSGNLSLGTGGGEAVIVTGTNLGPLGTGGGNV